MHNYFIILQTTKLAKEMQNTKTFSFYTSFFNNYCAEDMAANCRDKHIPGF